MGRRFVLSKLPTMLLGCQNRCTDRSWRPPGADKESKPPRTDRPRFLPRRTRVLAACDLQAVVRQRNPIRSFPR